MNYDSEEGKFLSPDPKGIAARRLMGCTMVIKIVALTLFASMNLHARIVTKNLCKDIISKTEFVVRGKVIDDLLKTSTDRYIRLKVIDVYPDNEAKNNEIEVYGLGKLSLEGIPELKGKPVLLFLQKFGINGKTATLVISPYSAIIEGQFGIFAGPVSYNKSELPDEFWKKPTKNIAKDLKLYCSKK